MPCSSNPSSTINSLNPIINNSTSSSSSIISTALAFDAITSHPSSPHSSLETLHQPSDQSSSQDVMVPPIHLSPSNALVLVPHPSQLALHDRPYPLEDIISPKSTVTLVPVPHPAESLGRARSLSLQRNHLRPWPPTSQLSLPQPVKPVVSEDLNPSVDHSNLPSNKSPFADYAITSTCHSYFSPATQPEDQLDWLSQSFGNSSSIDQTVWEPVQSFKKLVKRPRFSSGRSSIHFSSLSDSSSAHSSGSCFTLDPPSKRPGARISDEEILAELHAPSHSIEEENLKMELLRAKRAQLAASHSPLLTTPSAEALSSRNPHDGLTLVVPPKRKASKTIGNNEDGGSQTKIPRHSSYNHLPINSRLTSTYP